MKIIKQVDLSHCSLQSEMILDKCWTTAKHKFPHLLGKPVFCETHPAHCNTARTSELFSCPVPWDIHRASCVVPPYQRAGTWKPSRSAVLGCFLPFQSRNSVRHAASQTSMVSTGPSSCSVPPIPILLCTLQNLMRRLLPYKLHRLPPCTQACVPCNLCPHLLSPEAKQLEKGVQKDKVLVIPRQKFFPPLLPAC